jgi:hypothetical protein
MMKQQKTAFTDARTRAVQADGLGSANGPIGGAMRFIRAVGGGQGWIAVRFPRGGNENDFHSPGEMQSQSQ